MGKVRSIDDKVDLCAWCEEPNGERPLVVLKNGEAVCDVCVENHLTWPKELIKTLMDKNSKPLVLNRIKKTNN